MFVSLSASFSGTPSIEWCGGVYKNNGATRLTNLQICRKLGAGGDVGSVAVTGIVDLAANDTLEVWLEQSSGVDKDITVVNACLTATQIGGT